MWRAEDFEVRVVHATTGEKLPVHKDDDGRVYVQIDGEDIPYKVEITRLSGNQKVCLRMTVDGSSVNCKKFFGVHESLCDFKGFYTFKPIPDGRKKKIAPFVFTSPKVTEQTCHSDAAALKRLQNVGKIEVLFYETLPGCGRVHKTKHSSFYKPAIAVPEGKKAHFGVVATAPGKTKETIISKRRCNDHVGALLGSIKLHCASLAKLYLLGVLEPQSNEVDESITISDDEENGGQHINKKAKTQKKTKPEPLVCDLTYDEPRWCKLEAPPSKGSLVVTLE